MYECMNVYKAHTYIYTCIFLYALIYVYVCICMYVHKYVFMYLHTVITYVCTNDCDCVSIYIELECILFIRT